MPSEGGAAPSDCAGGAELQARPAHWECWARHSRVSEAARARARAGEATASAATAPEEEVAAAAAAVAGTAAEQALPSG